MDESEGHVDSEPSDDEEQCSDLPPRLDRPLEERIAWFERATKRLGGHPKSFMTDDPERTLRLLVEQYVLLDGPLRRLRDVFEPPLALPDPSRVPDHRLVREVERWSDLLATAGIFVVRCAHQPPRESLERIYEMLDRRDVGPLEGCALYLMVSEDCEECLLEWEIAMSDELESFESEESSRASEHTA